jgi:heat shock protein HtpX
VPIALSINALLLTYDQVLNFRILTLHDEADGPSYQLLQGQDGWGLLRTVRELCERLQQPVPQVHVVHRPYAQIFSYARTQRSAKLFITSGALDLLTPRQLRAVLVFELITIKNAYHVLNYWVGAWLDLWNRVGKWCERAFAFVFGWTPPLAAWLLSPWLAALHFFMIGRVDFSRLDREATRHVDHPEDLAFALWKLESYAQTQPWPDALTMAHMFIVSPMRLRPGVGLLRVQPPLQSRIKTIAGRYPL